MAAFATAAEFATRLGVTLTAGETTDAGTLLSLASDIIRDETGQFIEAVSNDTLTRDGVWSDRIRLPERPVTNVDSVTVDGAALTADQWHLEGDELVRTAGSWGGPEADLVIQYDHGFASIPGTVKAITMEMVRRVWVNPGNVRQEGYGSEQVSYEDANGLLLTDRERRSLQRVIRGGLGSIQLR